MIIQISALLIHQCERKNALSSAVIEMHGQAHDKDYKVSHLHKHESALCDTSLKISQCILYNEQQYLFSTQNAIIVKLCKSEKNSRNLHL
jgi:hypothetical protein